MLAIALAIFELLLKSIFDIFHKALMLVLAVAVLTASFVMSSILLAYAVASK